MVSLKEVIDISAVIKYKKFGRILQFIEQPLEKVIILCKLKFLFSALLEKKDSFGISENQPC